jgi:peptidoglycan hydrolase CwlO-like protein
MKHLRKVKDQIAQRDSKLKSAEAALAAQEREVDALLSEVKLLRERCKDRDSLLSENIILENQVEDMKKEIRDLETQLDKW